MIQLYLIRHGIAVDREDPNCPPDTERPLTSKGEKRSRAAARGLRALGVKPNLVLTSPWLRALQTAEVFCEEFDYPSKKIIRSDALKGTSAPADIRATREYREHLARVLVSRALTEAASRA